MSEVYEQEMKGKKVIFNYHSQKKGEYGTIIEVTGYTDSQTVALIEMQDGTKLEWSGSFFEVVEVAK